MDSDELASMYAQIVNGVPKDQSRYVTDDASSAQWDTIAAEVEQMKADNPDVQFSVPNELPSIDGEDDPAWTGVRRGGPATPPDADDTGEDEPAGEDTEPAEPAEATQTPTSTETDTGIGDEGEDIDGE